MHVTLEHVKGIAHLEFPIPENGLWLLTAPNGCGKTTLLAALYRIDSNRAFQDYFRTSATHARLDTFNRARIHYEIDGRTVTYRYAGTRWPPTPKRNSRILSEFPFPRVHYIEANAARIEPHPDEIQPYRINPASGDLRAFIADVMADPKWHELRYVNTRRGKGNEAYLLREGTGTPAYYYSEKNFSLGELCVLKLADKIVKTPANSLILIDEIEMALHPQAQVRLIKRLSNLATKKDLTIIFSTHSSTLIKNIDRQKIIYLRHDSGGHYTSVTNVYPATVLGEIAFDEEVDCDILCFVEDDQAKLLTQELIRLWTANEPRDTPQTKVVPIGGYHQVLQMLEASSEIFPGFVGRRALLDKDAWDENLAPCAPSPNKAAQAIHTRVKKNVKFLPCTPEKGVIEEIEQAKSTGDLSSLLISINGTAINLENALIGGDYEKAGTTSNRATCKAKFLLVAKYLECKSGLSIIEAQRQLYRWYCDRKYAHDIGALKHLLGPLLMRK